MASARHWVIVLLVAGAAAEGDRNATAAKDLSAEGTGLDYPNRFVPGGAHPVYETAFAPHHSMRWVPFQPYAGYQRAPIDPYVVQLMTRYARYLPQGLGLYGIYGSTGLPAGRPPGVFRFPDKASRR